MKIGNNIDSLIKNMTYVFSEDERMREVLLGLLDKFKDHTYGEQQLTRSERSLLMLVLKTAQEKDVYKREYISLERIRDVRLEPLLFSKDVDLRKSISDMADLLIIGIGDFLYHRYDCELRSFRDYKESTYRRLIGIIDGGKPIYVKDAVGIESLIETVQEQIEMKKLLAG